MYLDNIKHMYEYNFAIIYIYGTHVYVQYIKRACFCLTNLQYATSPMPHAQPSSNTDGVFSKLESLISPGRQGALDRIVTYHFPL